MKKVFIILLFSITQTFCYAQDRFPNTQMYNDSVGSPQAGLNILSWVEGFWKGEAMGGITEEVWTAPSGGSMMCVFKLIVNDSVKFYEIVTISQEKGSLILRLKHFHADLKGWEPQDKTQDFRLVNVSDNKVFFDGFTFERIGKKEMNIYVVIFDGKGKKEMKFNYKKYEQLKD